MAGVFSAGLGVWSEAQKLSRLMYLRSPYSHGNSKFPYLIKGVAMEVLWLVATQSYWSFFLGGHAVTGTEVISFCPVAGTCGLMAAVTIFCHVHSPLLVL